MSNPDQLVLDFGAPVTEGIKPKSEQTEDRLLDGGSKLAVQGQLPQTNAAISYTIKVSTRAKQVYLRAVPGRGLVVTIPKRFPKRDVPGIVETQRAWVEKALADLDAQIPEQFKQWPPHSLPLVACDSLVQLEYAPAPGDRIGARWRDESTLLIQADESDQEAVASCVAAALKKRARQILSPWLARLASEHGFNYKRLVVRGQRSVWGSYSSSGTLSLNYKLLFLNPELVDYVLLHELAHTRHLNHSTAFWNLLDQKISGARAIDRKLNDAGRLVPPWLELAK